MIVHLLPLFLLFWIWNLQNTVTAITRQYYITAEEVDWDYAPQQWDNLRDQPLNQSFMSDLYTARNATRLGTVYRKAVYRQYTDASFSIPIAHDPALGFLGPIIKAEAGDRIQVEFFNRASQPCSLHPHTIKATNGSLPGRSVQPNQGYHYVWDIPADLVFPSNQSSILWVYVSKANPLVDLNAGLVGPIVVYAPGHLVKASANSMVASLPGVQEVFTMMMTTDEGLSNYLPYSAQHYNNNINSNDLEQLMRTDDLFLESNRMYHINGYILNNNADLRVFYGRPVRWYILAFGLEDDDVHTAHWHGATLLYHGHRVDVVDLMPVSFEVLDMMPDNEGQWLFHCHVASHFEAGMTAFYQVEKLEYTGEEGWDG
ncbi:Cupredoxin [Halteromyces radiatus]|uniref:Cupredoxin n=1 Tax=Halteromyces radiatus TaxID=101107 RepID=UPI0022204EB7|nr:Cupredoxin [Halteromyces radiatus]KAI8089734.1 Cupredoxin [Halteromyces radiatus]